MAVGGFSSFHAVDCPFEQLQSLLGLITYSYNHQNFANSNLSPSPATEDGVINNDILGENLDAVEETDVANQEPVAIMQENLRTLTLDELNAEVAAEAIAPRRGEGSLFDSKFKLSLSNSSIRSRIDYQYTYDIDSLSGICDLRKLSLALKTSLILNSAPETASPKVMKSFNRIAEDDVSYSLFKFGKASTVAGREIELFLALPLEPWGLTFHSLDNIRTAISHALNFNCHDNPSHECTADPRTVAHFLNNTRVRVGNETARNGSTQELPRDLVHCFSGLLYCNLLRYSRLENFPADYEPKVFVRSIDTKMGLLGFVDGDLIELASGATELFGFLEFSKFHFDFCVQVIGTGADSGEKV